MEPRIVEQRVLDAGRNGCRARCSSARPRSRAGSAAGSGGRGAGSAPDGGETGAANRASRSRNDEDERIAASVGNSLDRALRARAHSARNAGSRIIDRSIAAPTARAGQGEARPTSTKRHVPKRARGVTHESARFRHPGRSVEPAPRVARCSARPRAPRISSHTFGTNPPRAAGAKDVLSAAGEALECPDPPRWASLKASDSARARCSDEIRENLIARLRPGQRAVPRHRRLRAHGRAADRERPAVAPRLHPARAARSGEDPAAALARRSSWTSGCPAIEGCPLNSDPFRPLTHHARTAARDATGDDDADRAGSTASERYQEKLATPDVTIADLIGDIDPIKAATLKLDYSGRARHPLRHHPAHATAASSRSTSCPTCSRASRWAC